MFWMSIFANAPDVLCARGGTRARPAGRLRAKAGRADGVVAMSGSVVAVIAVSRGGSSPNAAGEGPVLPSHTFRLGLACRVLDPVDEMTWWRRMFSAVLTESAV